MEPLRLLERCDINLSQSSATISFYLRDLQIHLWGLEILENMICCALFIWIFLRLTINRLFLSWRIFLVPIWYSYLYQKKRISERHTTIIYEFLCCLKEKWTILYLRILYWGVIPKILLFHCAVKNFTNDLHQRLQCIVPA